MLRLLTAIWLLATPATALQVHFICETENQALTTARMNPELGGEIATGCRWIHDWGMPRQGATPRRRLSHPEKEKGVI